MAGAIFAEYRQLKLHKWRLTSLHFATSNCCKFKPAKCIGSNRTRSTSTKQSQLAGKTADWQTTYQKMLCRRGFVSIKCSNRDVFGIRGLLPSHRKIRRFTVAGSAQPRVLSQCNSCTALVSLATLEVDCPGTVGTLAPGTGMIPLNSSDRQSADGQTKP